MSKVTTLNEFILDKQADFPFATGELSRILNDITVASKIVSRDVRKAGLVDHILGAQGETNIQGEDQQKLDVVADQQFIKAFENGGEVCGIASEENDDFVAFTSESAKQGKYVVLFDPLDGSSNIDVNVSIGTIFSIYRRVSEVGTLATLEDMLQPGTAMYCTALQRCSFIPPEKESMDLHLILLLVSFVCRIPICACLKVAVFMR
jgi:fructose-1,6-bisphosphatase I